MSDKFKKDQILTISLGHLAHDTYSAFLAPILPLLMNKLGMDLSMSAILDIVRKIPSLLNPFLGILAERSSVKYFVIVAPAISAITMSMLGLIDSYNWLIILLLISGIGSTLFHIPSPVIVKSASGNKVGLGMSFYMIGGELARTLGPILISGAISIWGLEGSYRVMPLGLIVSAILYFKLRKIEVVTNKKSNQQKGDTHKLLKKFLPFFAVIGGFSLFQAAMKSAVTLYLPTYLSLDGSSLFMASTSLSILQFMGVLGVFFAGHYSDKIGRRNMLLVSTIGSIVFMWLFVFFGKSFVIPILIFLGFFLFASGPVILAVVHETNSEKPSFINSIYMTINFGISSVMVYLVGFLGDKFGLEFTYLISAILAIFMIPFVFLIPKVSKMVQN